MRTQRTSIVTLRYVALSWALLMAGFISVCPAQNRTRPTKPAPTHADVSYAPHEQNAIDVWLAESAVPTPLVVYIHGGGFRGGSKNGINAETLVELLEAGISVASVEYRFISHQRLPAAHYDCLRALQFLRSKAAEWNFDRTRIGAFGGSAGAQLSMWLAFHDEMADPDSNDPIERESSRLACVATSGGQATMDFDWWIKWIPGYDAPHRDVADSFDGDTETDRRKIIEEVSVINHITADDPAIHMSYGMSPDDPVPSDPEKASGWSVHHVMFGIKLKEKLESLGIEADLKYPGASTTYESTADFFKTKFGKK